jgi:hypothetical protein
MAVGTRKNLAAGSVVYLALAGATLSLPGSVIVAAGDSNSYTTVGRAAKPVYNDTTWVQIPAIESVELAIDNGQGIEIWEPNPGAIEIADILRVGRKLTLKIQSQTTQPLTWQLLYRSLGLNASSTGYTPAAVPNELYAWIKIQVYDNTNGLTQYADLFCEVVLTSALKLDPKAITKPEYTATVLSSALNTGNFS